MAAHVHPAEEPPFWPEGATKERPKTAPQAAHRARGNGQGHEVPPDLIPSIESLQRPPLDWPDLATKEPPARKWAIKGWLGFGHTTLLVGSGGIGKTLLAQQMASCLALGKPFVGDVDEPRKCLMWACEDDHDELWRRQVNIAKWCNAGLEAFADNLVIVPRHGLENALVLTDFGKLAYSPLLLELKEQANDLNAEVVILDNVAQLYGAGENDRHAVTAFLNALSGVLPGKALMLLARPSRSSGSEFSGSSAWENVARTRLYLGATLPGERPDPEADPQDNVRYLARRKANYSPKDWRRMTYADGALTPDESTPDTGLIANIRAGNAEKAILSAITKLTSMGVVVSEGQRSPNYLPKLMAEYRIDDGLTKRELSAAVRSMMIEGKLKRTEAGKRQNRTQQYGLTATS